MTPAAFFARCRRDPKTGCLIYCGARCGGGYGEVRHPGGRREVAHRFAWKLAGRRITKKRPELRHTCDCRPCVELGHLRAGTHAQNMADMARKRRGRRSRRRLPPGVQPNRGDGSGKGYQARVSLGGRRLHLGTFPSIAEALAAVDGALGRA